MLGGEEQRRMSIDNDNQPNTPVPLNWRSLIPFDPSALNNVGQSSPSSVVNVRNGGHSRKAELIANHSKKLQDDVQELGQKIKHHEENVKYLKTLKIKLDESIIDTQVSLEKFHTNFSTSGDRDNAHVDSEKETIQHILKYEKSAAAFLCSIKSKPEAQVSDYPFVKDVFGILATLGKVDDDNLSRMLAEYLGIETMLGVVCKTYEGVKALETYKDGLINTSLGLHAFAASIGTPLDDRFLVFCLENLRPYNGELIAGDPQRRLDIQKPRLLNRKTPPGFLGFAVNMVSVDYDDLYCVTKTGHSLRETLFYNLFSTLQVYKHREDMMKALPFITNGAISLDGGIMRSPGLFSLGHHRENIDVKFPSVPKVFPDGYLEIQKRMKETTWKKDRTWEDLQREQALLEHAKLSYESKKKEFLLFLAESAS